MVSRVLENPPKYPAGYDECISYARGAKTADEFALKGAGSHVLLAACAANQSAWESKGTESSGGFFTTALIAELESKRPITTYRHLIDQLNLPEQ